MKTYKLRPAAEKDLEHIWQYTVAQWNVKQANQYTDMLVTAFDSIAEDPLLNRERSEFTPPVRIRRQTSHLIIYQVKSEVVDIIRILHKQMDIDSYLTDEGEA